MVFQVAVLGFRCVTTVCLLFHFAFFLPTSASLVLVAVLTTTAVSVRRLQPNRAFDRLVLSLLFHGCTLQRGRSAQPQRACLWP